MLDIILEKQQQRVQYLIINDLHREMHKADEHRCHGVVNN